MLGKMGKASSSARSPGLSLRKKSVACKRNERMQNECVEKTGDRTARNASVCTRSRRENVNGCLRYSLCLKFMQNTYFGILDIARNPREKREEECVMVRASIYKLHKSPVAHLCPARIAKFRVRMCAKRTYEQFRVHAYFIRA